MHKFHMFLCLSFFCGVANAQWGSALSFNGSPQYAHLGTPVDTITNNLTMEAWVKWTGSTAQLQPVVFNGGADADGYGLILDSNDHISILLGNMAWGTSDSMLHAGVWTHLAMVRNSGNWSLYLNGSSIAISGLTNQAPLTPSTDSYVGAANHANSYFNGAIDEVRISKVARYTSNFTPPSTPFTTDPNTVALYHFDDGSGLTTSDASGNGNTLTLVSAPGWVAGNNTRMAGSALKFSGSSDYVSIPPTCLSSVSSQITLEAWVNLSGSGETARIIDHITVATGDGFLLDLYNGQPRIIVGSGVAQALSALPANAWYHIAGTYNGDSVRIYVNGVCADSAEVSASVPSNSHDVYIGIDQNYASHFTGVIDEVRIWNIARNASEIAADMNNFYTGIPTGLIGYWQFNEEVGPATYDAISSSTATLKNFSFDGSDGWVTSTISVTTSLLPVELTSFAVSVSNLTTVLAWKTATEVNNAGFEIERQGPHPTLPLSGRRQGWEWGRVGSVAGAGTSNTPHHYSFTDNVETAGNYSYRLKQIDHNGAFTYSQEVQVQVGAAPKVFALAQNYPNPFNPTTTMQFTVPNDGRATLKVYNTLGQKVATLFDGAASAGEYHQATFDGSRFASGIYFARLEFGGQSLVKKLLMTK